MKFFFPFVFAFCFLSAQAQKSPVVLTMAGEDVTLEEFENIFRKNNRDSVITPKALDDYMEMFINFKMKVRAARDLGYDTVQKYLQELNGYRVQLARPYLTDADLLNDLVAEAYQRSTEEIRASHILIKVEPVASPADTAKAWAKISALRSRILAGEDFAVVAKGKDGSEDPSAKDNGGDLGYFTVFQMVYPFEDATWKTPVGGVSQPIRTKYGYHIIKVHDKRPARGEITVAHIMLKDKKDKPGDAEARIREIYTKLQSGESFEDLALKYSEDGSSNKKGGELPAFGTGKMVPEFENRSFALTYDGAYSEPFKTEYGWHIVKRLGLKPVPAFKDAEKELKTRVSKDSRAEKTRASFIEKLKKEYQFSMNDAVLKQLSAKVDTTVFEGKLNAGKKIEKQTLYTLAGKTHKMSEFTAYLKSRTGVRSKLTPQEYIMAEGKDFCEDAIIAYEDSRLEEKHKPFRLLMNEYREGILLFELTDKKVWSKAVKDSAGIQEYYNAHSGDYMWPERADVVIYTCSGDEVANQLKTMMAQGKDRNTIAGELNKNSKLNLQIEEGLFTREEKEVLNKVEWKAGMSQPVKNNGQVVLVDIRKITPPSPKKLEECKGLVTSDYQNYLEQEWIKELRKTYTYTINKEVLHSIR
ncbi:MAG: peptidylprolyl isomerase [Flavobacteriales bacterium]|nr:peptidylprolyl isomerase [Flavobacteriales bacterium]